MLRPANTWIYVSAMSVLWLTLLVTLTGCAGPSKPTPPDLIAAPTQPPISRPAVSAPGPSGAYWARHCKLVRSVRETVSPTEPLPEPCGTPGQAR